MDYTIFTESVPVGSVGRSQLNLDEKDKEFLINQKLIKEKNNLYYSNFVGEVITPHNSYFSLPKNQFDEELIDPIKALLLKYTKSYNHQSLVTNKGFILTKDDEFKSEKYYFDKLSSFFLDFVTYEFIYPLETKKVHSIQPLPGSIDILSTNINRQIYGDDGATYDVVDKKNSDKWRLDDIYYSTVIKLARETGTESDVKEIERMFEYLNEEGYDVKEIDISNKEEIIKEIKKCSVNIIHNPIKNILIEYFEDQLSLKQSGYKINIFYTKNFEVVWENILQEILFHDPEEFGQDFLDKFKKVITEQKYLPKEQERKWKRENPNIEFERDENNPNLINYQIYDAEPDIFSSAPTKIPNINKFKFIGDAKYYNDTKSTFHKEFGTYNDIMDNKYPMVLLVPSDKTNIRNFRFDRNSKKELVILNISIYDVINDYISGSKNLISDVHLWISKRSRRLNNQKE